MPLKELAELHPLVTQGRGGFVERMRRAQRDEAADHRRNGRCPPAIRRFAQREPGQVATAGVSDDHDRSSTGVVIRSPHGIRCSSLERPESHDAGSDPVVHVDRSEVDPRSAPLQQPFAHRAICDGRRHEPLEDEHVRPLWGSCRVARVGHVRSIDGARSRAASRPWAAVTRRRVPPARWPRGPWPWRRHPSSSAPHRARASRCPRPGSCRSSGRGRSSCRTPRSSLSERPLQR